MQSCLIRDTQRTCKQGSGPVQRAFGVGNLLADAEAGRWWEPGRPGARAPVLEATLYSKVLPVNCVTKYLPDPRFWLTFSSQIWNNKNQ